MAEAWYIDGDDIKEILDTELTAAQLAPFCTAANFLVYEKVSGTISDEDYLKEIAKWLGAHLAACSLEREVKTEEAGEYSATYSGTSSLGLDATLYGQQVKVLDTTGALANLGKKKAYFSVVN